MKKGPGAAFLMMGLAFVVIGLAMYLLLKIATVAFIGLGIIFFVIGFSHMRRERG